MSVASLCRDPVFVEDTTSTKSPQGGIDKATWKRRAGIVLLTHSDQLSYHASLKYFSELRDGAERYVEYRLFFFSLNPNLTKETSSLVDADGKRFIVRDIQSPRGHHWEIVGSFTEGAA